MSVIYLLISTIYSILFFNRFYLYLIKHKSMIRVIKYFTDIRDLKPYNVGEEKDFGSQRNQYLVQHGYAEFIKQTKVLEPDIKKKPNKK